VVDADVLLEQLIEDVFNLDAGDNAYAMLIDGQNGTFLAHPNSDFLLQPVSTLSKNMTMNVIENSERDGVMKYIQRDNTDKIYFFKAVPNTQWILAIEMDRKTEEAAFSALLTELVITAAIITLIVVLVVSWLVSFLFRDLGRVSKALEEIASGEGDLTQRLEPRSDDEVGQLATNFNTFVANMHAMVSKLSLVSSSLSEQSKQTAQHA
ncbi:chemotaxis protein, partial [Vibrio xuii]